MLDPLYILNVLKFHNNRANKYFHSLAVGEKLRDPKPFSQCLTSFQKQNLGTDLSMFTNSVHLPHAPLLPHYPLHPGQ